jgi:hypothetical protein
LNDAVTIWIGNFCQIFLSMALNKNLVLQFFSPDCNSRTQSSKAITSEGFFLA